MSRIFISHSSEDNRQAIALHQWLIDANEELGGEIFLDLHREAGIAAGEKWKNALRAAADRCEAVICLLSPNWEASPECWAEFRFAEYLGKRIFTARISLSEIRDPTLEWQQVTLVGDGPTTSIDIGDGGEHVEFTDDGLARLNRGIVAAGIGAKHFSWPPADDPGRAPYRGWQPLEQRDAAVFFGRDAQIVAGLDELAGMRNARRDTLFVILGSSGTGKSSFLRAGLLPRLARDDHNFVLLDIVRPQRLPLTGESGLARAVHAALTRFTDHAPPLGEVKNAMRTGDVNAVRSWLVAVQNASQARLLDGEDTAPPPTIVLPVDQAEELLDAGAEADGLFTMIADLGRVVDPAEDAEPRVDLIVAMTIRTDSYQGLQLAKPLQGLGSKTFNDLRPLPHALFKDVITGPAERSTAAGHRLQVEPQLVNQLLADCTEGGDTLPLLALTLGRLFEDFRRYDTAAGGAPATAYLRLADYETLGGVDHVVQTEIDGLLDPDPDTRSTQLGMLRDAFIPWLATANSASGDAMRRIARWDEIPERSKPLIEKFIDKRLLVRDGLDGQTVVQVALESLLRQWTELAGWLAEERQSLITAEDLERTATAWQKSGGDEAWLLDGSRLDEASTLMARPQFAQRLSTASDFIAESARRRDARIAAQRTRSRILRGVSVLTAVAAVVAIVVAFVAVNATNTAETRLRAATAAKLATDGQAILAGQRAGNDEEGIQEILAAQALDPGYGGAVFNTAVTRANLVKFIDTGGAVNFTAISPDGTRVATTGSDKLVRRWDPDAGKQVGDPLPGVNGVDFSPDGRTLAVGSPSDDENVRLYNAGNGTLVRTLRGSTGPTTRVAFSPRGDKVAAGNAHGEVSLWDAATGALLHTFAGADGIAFAVAFSPTQPLLATSGEGGRLRIWNTDTYALIHEINSSEVLLDPADEGTVESLAFSSDGAQLAGTIKHNIGLWSTDTWAPVSLYDKPDVVPHVVDRALAVASQWDAFGDNVPMASSGSDGTVHLWGRSYVATDLYDRPLPGQSGAVQALAMSKDGRRLAAGSADGSLRIWAPLIGAPIPRWPDTGEPVTSIALGADSTADRVFVPGIGTIRQFSVPDGTVAGPDIVPHMSVKQIAYSPSAQALVVLGDNAVEEWGPASGGQLRALDQSSGVSTIAVSSTGTIAGIRAGSNDVDFWSADSGRTAARRISTHQKVAYAAAFSGDGHLLAVQGYSGSSSSDESKSIDIFDVNKSSYVRSIPVPTTTGVLAVDPAGHRIAIAGDDGTMTSLNADSGATLHTYAGHQGTVNAVAFSPDGHRLATAGNDGTVRLWDADNGGTIGNPLKSGFLFTAVAFSSDGRYLAAPGDVIHIWPATATPADLCARLTTNMTHEKWAKLAPGVPYQAPCQDLPQP